MLAALSLFCASLRLRCSVGISSFGTIDLRRVDPGEAGMAPRLVCDDDGLEGKFANEHQRKTTGSEREQMHSQYLSQKPRGRDE